MEQLHRLLFQLIQLHPVLLGQLLHNVEIPLPVGAAEGDGQPKPGGQAHQLLAGVALVDVVALPVGEGLLNQVAAVAGGVDGDVAGPAAHAALQDRLEGGEVVVIGGEAQIID